MTVDQELEYAGKVVGRIVVFLAIISIAVAVVSVFVYSHNERIKSLENKKDNPFT